MAANPIADIAKLVAKPETFGGSPSDWPEFRFQLENYMACINARLVPEMTAAREQPGAIDMDTVRGGEEGAEERCILLYSALANMVTGEPATIAGGAPRAERSGYELWRLLCIEYEPSTGSRRLVLLTRLSCSVLIGRLLCLWELAPHLADPVRR